MKDREVHPQKEDGRSGRMSPSQPFLPLGSAGRSPEILRRWALEGRVGELDDVEILSVLLGPERATGKTMRLARDLVTRGLLARDGAPASLKPGLEGLGPVRKARLLAALELAHRLHPPPIGLISHQKPLEAPRQVYDWARAYSLSDREHFLVLHLNTRHVPRKLEVISIGSLDASIVHPREVFRSAIREATAAIILIHNHPSGDPHPSRDDIHTTDRLVQAGRLVGIRVLDHVIMAGEQFFSFREEGVIDPDKS
ncbi:MAG: JAB domain-containing protein [Candidatus Eisenbacteria bacterium]|uniref:JAB domain-containing protein n=1 Tax=Eiseniibacteriota bacterium TaxID=2212470 RepID=A0A948RWH9_UNCEI|nr:JAB domain-containing protein [Candidatus Eisenbacteria bacterium]MBU1949469.1 JAB domain-containing protein [Candidatus Eisenbacteria bacterium]MBU2692145.1 JAB domain-containing protein [Candidatus Eisenbacteria bacterium]